MSPKRPRIPLICLLAFILALGACEINKLRSAEDHYENKRYAAAIEELDNYIEKGANGALITRSKILRAKCYYELGLMALQRENWDLCIRFFKLSNSAEADEALGSVYKNLSDQALAEGNPSRSLEYVNAIIREMPDSPLIPEMLQRRISFRLDTFIDHNAAWQDYMYLYDTYPNNVFEVAARKQIMRIIEDKADYARRLYTSGYHTEALRILFELGKYPVVDNETNNRMIAEAYINQAESYLQGEDYLEADRFFRIAAQYDPSIEDQVNRRLGQVAELFIEKGDELAARKEYENAMLHYQKAYEIIPDYPPATAAIARLETILENIARARDIQVLAQKAESSGNYREALDLYQQANDLDSKPEYREKAAQMQNLILAQTDPTGFARRIITEYRGGLINSRIQARKRELLEDLNPNEIRDSGWKVMITAGQYRYEVRYDLVTPMDFYYYVWQVNLRDRSITPLNKLSESLMR